MAFTITSPVTSQVVIAHFLRLYHIFCERSVTAANSACGGFPVFFVWVLKVHKPDWPNYRTPLPQLKLMENPLNKCIGTRLDSHSEFSGIMHHRRMTALILLMKHIRQRDMMELLDRLPRVMVEWISPEQVRVLINYMVNAGEAPAPEFMRALAQRLPQHEDELMTIAQQLEQIGIEKGLKQGIQLGEERGIEKGRNEGKLEVARSLLKMGMPHASVLEATGLTEDDLAQLRH